VLTFRKSAFKHGITQDQIDDILRSAHTEVFDEGFDRTGHYNAMYVGFDSQGTLLEVKVKFGNSRVSSKESVCIFHADKARKKYQRWFNQRKGR